MGIFYSIFRLEMTEESKIMYDDQTHEYITSKKMYHNKQTTVDSISNIDDLNLIAHTKFIQNKYT